MGEEIGLHLLLNAVLGPLGIVERGLVNRRVAEQAVQRLLVCKLLDLVAEFPHASEVVEIAFHRGERVRVETVEFGNCLHLAAHTSEVPDETGAGAVVRQSWTRNTPGGQKLRL